MIVVLAGGVGAARFLEGLVRVVRPEDITIIGNTGDDIELYGLHISPDLDIVTYTLAGIVDPERGWGVRGDTFHSLEMLRGLGNETWFTLGDRDLATHIYRTGLLKQGETLSDVTRKLAASMGVKSHIIPMSNDPVRTIISTWNGLFHFEEYLVRRGAVDKVKGVIFDGASTAVPAPGVIEAIEAADVVVLPPSNPIVSIGPILSIRGVRQALVATDAPVIGVSPIVNGAPVKGPADKLMAGLGFEVSPIGVAEVYRGFLDALIVDNQDTEFVAKLRERGVHAYATNTIMNALESKISIAKAALETITGFQTTQND